MFDTAGLANISIVVVFSRRENFIRCDLDEQTSLFDDRHWLVSSWILMTSKFFEGSCEDQKECISWNCLIETTGSLSSAHKWSPSDGMATSTRTPSSGNRQRGRGYDQIRHFRLCKQEKWFLSLVSSFVLSKLTSYVFYRFVYSSICKSKLKIE